jgi:hypothetical protein
MNKQELTDDNREVINEQIEKISEAMFIIANNLPIEGSDSDSIVGRINRQLYILREYIDPLPF